MDHQEKESPKGRRRTMLKSVRRRKERGELIPIEFNAEGQAIGENKTDFAQYIGCIARSHTNINHGWRQVPVETKEKIWDDIRVSFTIIPHIILVQYYIDFILYLCDTDITLP